MKVHRTLVKEFSLLLVVGFFICRVTTPHAGEQQAEPELPHTKQTSLGLYLTARQAYERWLADPENTTILDVRTTEEYIFIGHAAMAWNVPLMSQTYEWDASKQHFAMKPNPGFVSQVMELAKPADTILVMCRSGGRSAEAVNLLAQAGLKRVYNITDGMEGDEVKDPASVYLGKRLMNGWKNSGLPWTYQPDPDRMRFAKRPPEAADRE